MYTFLDIIFDIYQKHYKNSLSFPLYFNNPSGKFFGSLFRSSRLLKAFFLSAFASKPGLESTTQLHFKLLHGENCRCIIPPQSHAKPSSASTKDILLSSTFPQTSHLKSYIGNIVTPYFFFFVFTCP